MGAEVIFIIFSQPFTKDCWDLVSYKSIMGTFLLMLACKVNMFYRSIFTYDIKYFNASSQLIAFRGPTTTVIDFGHLKS